MIRLEHPAGQLGLGGEADPVGDTGGPAACRIVNPVLGQVQLAVDHPMPSLSCVGQVDGDRGVVDLVGGAGVLTVHPDRVAALLEVAGLVDHQHRGGVSQVQVGQGEQYAYTGPVMTRSVRKLASQSRKPPSPCKPSGLAVTGITIPSAAASVKGSLRVRHGVRQLGVPAGPRPGCRWSMDRHARGARARQRGLRDGPGTPLPGRHRQ
jgi:hypothetical protein